jgi:hypothetical protein
MGESTIAAYQCNCDVCGTAAAAALDSATAQANAVAAGFKTYTIPQGAPRAGAQMLVCPTCVTNVGELG